MPHVPARLASQPGFVSVPLGSVPVRLDGLLRAALGLANKPPSQRPAEAAALLQGVLDWVGRLDRPDILAMLELPPGEAELLNAFLGARELAERRWEPPVTWERRPLVDSPVQLQHAPWALVDPGDGLLEWWWLPADDAPLSPERGTAYARLLAGQAVRVSLDALLVAVYQWRWGRPEDINWETHELNPRLDYDARATPRA